MDSPPEKIPVRTYSPAPAMADPLNLLREMFADLRISRGLAWQITLRDFKALYRQSYAGYLWAFLPPLFASATFIILQSGNVVNFAKTDIPYVAFVLIGTILWQVFADSLSNPMRVMQSSKPMLTKINFPREALILSALQMSLINFAIRLVILIPIALWFRFPIGGGTLLFPVGILALILLGTTIGLFLATIGMLYQDVARGLMLVTNLWMFLTPVVFPVTGNGLAGRLMQINPVTPLLETSRDWFTGKQPDMLGQFLLITALTLVGLAIAWIVYRIFLPRVIERLGM